MNDNLSRAKEIHAKNVNFQTSSSENGAKQKNRPKETPLKHQKVLGWQPIFSVWTVIPVVFIIGLASISIGVVLLLINDSAKEKIISYESCNNGRVPARCNISFYINEPFESPVYFYYGIKNYFQNHRQYLKSRSDQQLHEVANCGSPWDKDDNMINIAPCGAVANSMFNDTFSLYFPNGNNLVPWTHDGVAWEVDKNMKFRNPGLINNDDCRHQTKSELERLFKNYSHPRNWEKEIWDLSEEEGNTCNNGFMNTDFIVWMRTAALPAFRKPYRIFNGRLPKGYYRLEIMSNYPVVEFHGKKSFIIATTSWIGSHDSTLAIAYIVGGSICLMIGTIFLYIHLKFGYKSDLIGVQ
uniref:Cell cycle control protein 50A n=1 Tax=Acrobeloides nanus TaxID=290746 RepID=A0A914ECX6_9BILA